MSKRFGLIYPRNKVNQVVPVVPVSAKLLYNSGPIYFPLSFDVLRMGDGTIQSCPCTFTYAKYIRYVLAVNSCNT